MPTSKDVGQFLEQQARARKPVTYGTVVARFPEVGKLTGNWKSHPLCDIFGELDGEDHRNNRPFRTALVFGKESNRPGHGFYSTLERLRGTTILEQEQVKVWTKELDAVFEYYDESKSPK